MSNYELSQEELTILNSWQNKFKNTLNSELKKVVTEMNALPALNTQSQHTHPNHTYDVNAFNYHNNALNGYRNLTFDITINEVRKYVVNDLVKENEILSNTIAIKNDTRVTRTFKFNGLFVAYYPEKNKYFLILHYTLNNSETKLLKKRFTNTQELIFFSMKFSILLH